MIAYLLLGSNVEPERHLPVACRALARLGRIRRVSRAYRSAPQAGARGGDFLNAAVALETELPLPDLRRSLRELERELGRVRPAPAGAPRTMDVDLLLAEGGPPHPDILRFAHAAVPLAEILPGGRHPETGEALAELGRRLERTQPLEPLPELRLV